MCFFFFLKGLKAHSNKGSRSRIFLLTVLWLEFIRLPEMNWDLSQRIGTRSTAVASGFINPLLQEGIYWGGSSTSTIDDEEERDFSWHLV